MIGDIRQFPFVGKNCGKIIQFANEIESAQRFPDLFGTGIEGRDFISGGDGVSGSHRQISQAAGDG